MYIYWFSHIRRFASIDCEDEIYGNVRAAYIQCMYVCTQ